ncbi:MAG: hypothetical protein NT051_02335, partial [Candidatus Micrarchaeota archaeon]|nr:hypothetical protein [Candidatus Micrarchaeota archaeon]
NENSFMANRINSVFPLAGYLDFPPFVNHGATAVCFADNGSYLILPNNSTIVPNFNWAVAFNNQTSLHVPPSSVSCAPIALGSQYSYEWKLNLIDVDTNVSGVATFVPRTATYTRMTMDFGILQGLVMIPVFYLLVVYPFVGLKRKILEGIEAQ